MKNSKLTKSIVSMLAAVICMAVTGEAQTQDFEGARATEVHTSQGVFPLDERGMPKPETIHALYDELDYQSAVQTYLWVSYAKIHLTAKFSDLLSWESQIAAGP